MLGGFQNKLKKLIPTAGGVKSFMFTYVASVAAAIAAVGLAYQYAEPGPDGRRNLKGSWQSWAYGLGSVALVTMILGSLKMKQVKDIVTDKFAQSVMMLTAGLILVFDQVIAPQIRANPDGYLAKIFFATGELVNKDKAASAKAELLGGGGGGGGVPPVASTQGGAISANVPGGQNPATGGQTPTSGDPLAAIAATINNVASQVEMATGPIGGSVPGGTAGIGYGGWATALQGLSGAPQGGDAVFGALVRQAP